MGINISTAGTAGAVVRLGIYKDDGTGIPGALVADWGTVDSSAGGVKNIAITTVLAPGLYWPCAVPQVAACSWTGLTGITPLVPCANGGVFESADRNAWASNGVTGARGVYAKLTHVPSKTPSSFVTVSGAAVGDPSNRRSWSGSAFHFFSELERRGYLHRSIAAKASRPSKALALARNFNRDRGIWLSRLNLDTAYRDALTSGIRRAVTSEDLQHNFLQIGGYYDTPSVLGGATSCDAYYDGNLAIRLRAPLPLLGLSPGMIDNALQYERTLLQDMRLVFTMSEYLRQSFIKDYDLPAGRVVTIGGGMNFDTLPTRQSGKDYSKPDLLFIGVDFRRKGGWILLEAFRGVRRSIPDAMLHIVGPTSLDIPAELANGVVNHGFLPKSGPDLADLFARCVLFVMPSLYEPFGIAPMEAMAHQLPAVVSGEWALQETVEPGRTGEHVRPGDALELENTLVTLLRAPDQLRVMGEAARTHVMAECTWERVVGRLIAATEAAPAHKA